MDADPNSVLLGACPQTLERVCIKTILGHVVMCGTRVEAKAKKIIVDSKGSNSNKVYKRRRRSSLSLLLDDATSGALTTDDTPDFLYQSEIFQKAAAKGRLYLMTHLSTCCLDNLIASLDLSEVENSGDDLDGGHCFALCCLTNERLSMLNILNSAHAE